MTRAALLIASAAAALGALAPAAAAAPALTPPPGAAMPDELLVRFAPGADAGERAAARRAAGVEVDDVLPVPGLQLVKVEPGTSTPAADAALERRPEVLYAEPNWVLASDALPNDAFFDEQWGLHNVGQQILGTAGTPDADVDGPEAWDLTTGSPDVVIGVADDGVDYDQPDLEPNIWANPGETGGGKETDGVDNDGNGRVDDHRGYDFGNDDNDPTPADFHGTHVAGIAAAAGGNGIGVAGTSFKSRIMPLRVGEFSTTAALIQAYGYARQMGARIVNVSLSGPSFSQAQLDAINAAPNVLFVVSASNDGVDNDAVPRYPCNFSAPNIVCVAATNQSDGLAGFSNFGAQSVDLGAPGVRVLSTMPPLETPFSDGFETPIAGRWTTGGTPNTWGRVSGISSAGDFSFADSPAGGYPPDASSFARTGALDLTGLHRCNLQFTVQLDAEEGFDFLLVELSTDGTSWTLLDALTGSTEDDFGGYESALPAAFQGQPAVFLRLRLTSDASVEGDGAYVDELRLRCHTTAYDGSEFAYASGTSMSTPMVAGAAALIWARDPSASVAGVKARLLSSVDPLPALAGKTVSGGRLNAHKALLASDPPAPGPGGQPQTPPQNPPNPEPPIVEPEPDRLAPGIRNLLMAPTRIRQARGRGASVRAAGGARVTYALTEAADVRFTVARRTTGRRVGGRCVKRTRSNRKRRRCTLVRAVKGSFARPSAAGPSSFRFTGRMDGRPLKPGLYQLEARALDASKNLSPPARVRFEVVKR